MGKRITIARRKPGEREPIAAWRLTRRLVVSIVSASIAKFGRPVVRSKLWFTWSVCASVLLACWAGAAAAQSRESKTPNANLNQVTAVRVTASQITPDGITCGLSLEDVTPRIEHDVKAGGLRVRGEPDVVATISLLTTHDKIRGVCATAAMLGVYELVSYFDAKEGWTRSGYVVLWQRGNLVISTPTDHPDAIDRRITLLTAKFLDSWRSDREQTETIAMPKN